MINIFKKPQTQIENKTFNKNSPIISDKQIKEEEINTEIKSEKTNLITKFNETKNDEIFMNKKKKRKEKDLQKVHKTAAQLKDLTQNMAQEINKQGEILDNIEANVEKCR